MGARNNYLIDKEATHIQNGLGACPDFPQRCVTAVAKAILLKGTYFYNGKLINPVAKSLGAGVWEISHKEVTP